MRSVARNLSKVAWVIGVALIVGGLLAACGGGQPAPTPTQVAQAPAPTQPPTQTPPTNTAIPPTATTAPATTAPAATAAPTITTAPTATKAVTATSAVAVAPASTDATSCITCHTDEATLQKLAKAEEPKETLSEGEG